MGEHDFPGDVQPQPDAAGHVPRRSPAHERVEDSREHPRRDGLAGVMDRDHDSVVGGAIDEKFLAGTAPTQVAPAPGAQNPATFLMQQ